MYLELLFVQLSQYWMIMAKSIRNAWSEHTFFQLIIVNGINVSKSDPTMRGSSLKTGDTGEP